MVLNKMKFNLHKASNWNFETEIEFNSLEELIKYMKKIKQHVIIRPFDPEIDKIHKNEFTIVIYDDNME